MEFISLLRLSSRWSCRRKAQQLNYPKTVTVHNNKTGEVIGTITVTVTGTTAYVRNKDGEHIYTVVQNPDGSKTAFDPNGKVIELSARP